MITLQIELPSCGASHEPVQSVHPSSCRDDLADPGHFAGGGHELLPAASIAVAADRFSDDSGQCITAGGQSAVYLVLGMLYESFIHPLTILSTLPSAGVGALIALMVCQTPLDVMAMIGILLLIGIVKKNAIMMIDFALEAERRQGLAAREAIFEACLHRFRPITMTTLAALLGGLPLALGSGIGAELRRPLGIAIVGGLVLSQLLTLYTTPVVYLYLDRLRRRPSPRAESLWSANLVHADQSV